MECTNDTADTALSKKDTRIRALLIAALRYIILSMIAVSAAQIAAHFIFRNVKTDSNITAVYYAILDISQYDSWKPMLQAHDYLAKDPNGDLYKYLFFDRGVKFQYPLTSLIFVDWFSAATEPVKLLNIANKLLFLATAVAMGLLTIEQLALTSLHEVIRNRSVRILVFTTAMLAALCFYPLIRSVRIGQIQTLITFLFVTACIFHVRGKTFISGFLVGLCSLIKPQWILFLFWAAIRKDYRFLTGWAAPVASGFVTSLIFYGPYWPLEYGKVLSFIGAHGESFFANQSVNGLVNRILMNGPNLTWEATKFAPFHPIVYYATLISSALFALIGIGSDRLIGLPIRSDVSLMLAAISFTMASPVAWEHHYSVLLPAFAFCFVSLLAEQQPRFMTNRQGWICLAVLFALAGNYISLTNSLANTTLNFLQSYVFFSAIGMLLLTSVLAISPSQPKMQPDNHTKPKTTA